jgi:hypothetical protein
MKRLAPLMTISLLVAIGGLARPALYGVADSPLAEHMATFAAAALWRALLLGGFVIHGKRGLWLLTGAPIALFVPLLWTFVHFICQCSIFQEH